MKLLHKEVVKRSLKQLENRCDESKRLPTELDDKELYVIVRQKSSNSKYKDVYITTHIHAQAVIFTYKNTYIGSVSISRYV